MINDCWLGDKLKEWARLAHLLLDSAGFVDQHSIQLIAANLVCFLSFILNAVCFATVRKIKIKKTNLYKYLNVYALNSSLTGLFKTLFFCIQFDFIYLKLLT